MKKFFNKQSGFTLVELLVVIAIIAVLGVVAIVAINPATRINAAKDNQALANVQSIGKAFEACLADKMITGSTAQASYNACCGSGGVAANGVTPGAINVAGLCASGVAVGLGFSGYGYQSGWPATVAVNRSAWVVSTNTATICVSQVRGSDTRFVKYVTGGGTVSTSATATCTSGV